VKQPQVFAGGHQEIRSVSRKAARDTVAGLS
jgi:hypothetical protein